MMTANPCHKKLAFAIIRSSFKRERESKILQFLNLFKNDWTISKLKNPNLFIISVPSENVH